MIHKLTRMSSHRQRPSKGMQDKAVRPEVDMVD